MTLSEWEKRVNLGSTIQKTIYKSLAEASSTSAAARRRVLHLPLLTARQIPTVTGWETSSSGGWVRSDI
jgi:hypothetical protein